MKTKIKISVIVPVYQVEKYLEKCISSIIEQTYKNIEIILVDDGSTDKSLLICKDFEKRDSRITVIHKENGGLSSARNTGIKKATGDFITFVDSDDWLDKSIYKHCVNAINENGELDVVDYDVQITNNYNVHKKNIKLQPQLLNGVEILEDYLVRGQTDDAPFSVCKKVYKRELFENITFPEGKINEDIATNYKLLMNAKKLVHLNEIGYYYYQRDESITVGKYKNKDRDLLVACDTLCRLTEEKGTKKGKKYAKIKKARSYFSLLSKIAYYGYDESIKNIKTIKKEYIHEVRKNYFILIFSSMPINRKIILTLFAINYSFAETFIRMAKKVLGKK